MQYKLVLMNYYILPKNNFNITINPHISDGDIVPYVSYSLIHYLNNIYRQLLLLEDENKEINIDYINKIVNPFEFIHTNVPGSVSSVSKVKPEANIFFELMEICQICNMSTLLSHLNKKLVIYHITPNYPSTNYLINMLREDCDDIVINENFDYNTLREKYLCKSLPTKVDLFLFELNDSEYTNVQNYLKNIVLILFIVVKCQNNGGTCIIKIDNTFYKLIVDMLFIFSCVYEKVYIIKPSICKITKGERYVVCKNMNSQMLLQNKLLTKLEENIDKLLLNNENSVVHSLVENQISYHFLNKIEESNVVIGQQQLESYDLVINIFKNKNKEDKIEALKRNHIQKCVQWCEKNQIPHNKFTDKINIFLNSSANATANKKKECDYT
jgi:hypothetical protein